MKIENKTKESKRAFFRELYENAKNLSADTFSSLERNMTQYRGSDELDGASERALTVRNITYEIVESQVSSDIPMPKADPASYSERRSRAAESIERLCRSLRDRLPFEELNDIDERYTYIYGGSVWYVDWDSSCSEDGEEGGIKLSCICPRDFVPQPGIFSVDDMEYCFLKFTTTRGELLRKYKVKEGELPLAECEYEYGGEGDAVAVTVCFYKDEDGAVGRYIFSGEITLSDIPKYYMRKMRICKVCGGNKETCDCHGEGVLQDVEYEYPSISLIKDCQSEPIRIAYYVPSRFPIVIRKNTSGEKSLFGQSDCDYVRPEQQAINKIESRILQKLLRAGVTPIVPEDATISVNNSVFGQVIRMKPGESAAQYGKVDTTPDISQDIAEAERLYDHAKRIMGISDAFQGIDTGAASESGYAKQLRISQASGRLESKRKMKHTAYAKLDRIIFELHLAFADEPRNLSYKDAYGRIHNTEFNRRDFIEYDRTRGEYFYNDAYLFSVDLNGGAEYQREAQWKRNLENLTAGTLGNPESPTTLLRYWQCQERAHYPYARENVEYFTREVEKQEGGIANVEEIFGAEKLY